MLVDNTALGLALPRKSQDHALQSNDDHLTKKIIKLILNNDDHLTKKIDAVAISGQEYVHIYCG